MLSFIYASSNIENQEWLKHHFRNLESYIRERERWAIAPTNSTQTDLRRDFAKMSQMYISGYYGDYEWQEELPALAERSKEPTLIQKIFRIMVIALPIILLVLLFYNPAIPENLGIDATALTLLVIAWLLLVIDASLSLGIVERVTGVARAIKELK